MPGRSADPPFDDRFWSFVRELASTPQAADVLSRLRAGHEPDGDGWCIHQAHSHHWEQHPCFTRRLADLADSADEGRPPEQPA